MSPRDPDGWYLLYQYQFDGTALSAPRPVTALQVRSEGHTGGGLAVLDDGTVLFASGDNGDSYEDGREHGQNPAVHLAKLVRINPGDGSTSIAAFGVRAAQRLAIYTFADQRWLTFVDPGGWVAEELNAAPVSELSGGTAPLNFGWGRGPVDGKSREGTFYIDRTGNSTGRAPDGEPAFVQPVAEVGREIHEPFALSGPVQSSTSFSRITMLVRRSDQWPVVRDDRAADEQAAGSAPRHARRRQCAAGHVEEPDRERSPRSALLQLPRRLSGRAARTYRRVLSPFGSALTTGTPAGTAARAIPARGPAVAAGAYTALDGP